MHGSKNNLSIKKIQIEGSFRTVLEDRSQRQTKEQKEKQQIIFDLSKKKLLGHAPWYINLKAKNQKSHNCTKKILYNTN